MADEELHKTSATDENGQRDWQSETATSGADTAHTTDVEDSDVVDDNSVTAVSDDAKDAEDTKDVADVADDEDYGVPMDKVEALLNATADRATMTPQMRRVAQRQEEDRRRVEETVKETKANPSWFVPLFCTLMIIGLIWAVVYYLTSNYPIPNIGAWNLAIAFAIIMVGFLMTMWWH